MLLQSSGSGGGGARRRLNLSVTLPPTLTPLTAAQHVPDDALRALSKRGYTLQRFLKQSLYGCVVVAHPPPSQQSRQAADERKQRQRVWPIAAPLAGDCATACDKHSDLLDDAESSGVASPTDGASSNSDDDGDDESDGGESGLVCVKISRLVLAQQLTSPGSDGRLTAVRDRTLAEARLLHLSRSAHVVELVDEWHDSGFHFLATAFAGPELHQRVAERALSPSEAGMYLRQLVSALSTLHARGIAHLDLSLTNCCVDGRGRLRLIDFGVADGGDATDDASDKTRPLAHAAASRRGSGVTVAQPKQVPSLLQHMQLASHAQPPQAQSQLAVPQPFLASSRPSSIEPPRSHFASIAVRVQECDGEGEGEGEAEGESACEDEDRRDAMVLSDTPRSNAMAERSELGSMSSRRDSMRGGSSCFAFGSNSEMGSRAASPSSAMSMSMSFGGGAMTSACGGMDSLNATPDLQGMAASRGAEFTPPPPSANPGAFSSSNYYSSSSSRQRRFSATMLPPSVLSSLALTTPKRHAQHASSDTPASVSIFSASALPSALYTPCGARFDAAASASASSSFLSPASVSSTPLSQQSSSAAALSWPSITDPSRLRADLPPSKPHCQSPEQRACASYHMAAVAPQMSSSNSVAANSSTSPLWNPFECDLFALGPMLFEMLTGTRWQPDQSASLLAHPLLPPHASALIQQCTAPASERITLEQVSNHPFLVDCAAD